MEQCRTTHYATSIFSDITPSAVMPQPEAVSWKHIIIVVPGAPINRFVTRLAVGSRWQKRHERPRFVKTWTYKSMSKPMPSEAISREGADVNQP
ncbi:hypothetical protein TPAR_02092 [Tolypocladium paradoxum]|uniref:Uncharacterized protein n=1 Tax=Tolypocladium paradoxum TaxID=94208 RepID=A0A2S4L5N8_9HYPO|nr:hypothetical protein TPAR_02092 [Tolypocladium paradoxum]